MTAPRYPREIFDPPADMIDPALEQNPEGRDLRRDAERWIDAHPEVYRVLRHYAREAVARGKPFGVKWLVERARWDFVITRGEKDFAINNNLTAYVARALARDVPGMLQLVRFRRTVW